MPGRREHILITCEHASNHVPKGYSIPKGILNTHNAYDKNALYAAERLAQLTSGRLLVGSMTRLIADLNRDRPTSSYVCIDAKIADYHRLWRKRVIRDKRRIHISMHSFTPVLKGVVRKADIGLLYDPSRENERLLCMRFKKALQGHKVRMNYPYKGVSQGLTTTRRNKRKDYAGIEIELNQKLSRRNINDIIRKLSEALSASDQE
ncbi:MAG: N-formylglutamate amidohydrolase [Candidatus Woesearchaeota archaeon]